ncbi:hypothetical protein UFOVP71_217 [uncultured Caudovirales phage]|uniref:Uncharacterized protein n=1 Tax=uncultured Caudovirales phage TaxID=2100421 RepID=A0A6J5TBL4_9CAUD|nr:hypothetical protein UFOVP71_217 [uncultured Caudovirales phage]
MRTFNRNSLLPEFPISGSLDKRAPFKNSTVESTNKVPLIKLALVDVDFKQLADSVNDAMKIYGAWNYQLGDNKVDAGYGGIGLSYNPDLPDYDVHQQVQGNASPAKDKSNPFTMLTPDEGKLYVHRNSHYDTYGLSYRTPASKHGYLGTFLDTCKRTMVRSAVRIIYADQEGPVGEDKYAGVTWHRDESVFENLRVNIPLITDPIFLLEQEGHQPVHLEAGYAYSWDTNIPHRAYAKERVPKHRIHLMLGFSCWWDFDESTGNWKQNEFFGKKHPKDMLIDGDVIPGLTLV